MNKSSRAMKRISESAGVVFVVVAFYPYMWKYIQWNKLKAQLSNLSIMITEDGVDHRSPSLSFKDSGVRLLAFIFLPNQWGGSASESEGQSCEKYCSRYKWWTSCLKGCKDWAGRRKSDFSQALRYSPFLVSYDMELLDCQTLQIILTMKSSVPHLTIWP